MQPDDKLPPVPVNGINKSDGRGSYKMYKYGNYQPTPEVVVADAESAVAEAESAVAEAGTAAASSNALGSPTVAPTEMDSPTESIATTASLEVRNTDGETVHEFIQRTRPTETSQYSTVLSRGYPPVGGGTAVRRVHHSAPRSGWSDPSWVNSVWNTQMRDPSSVWATSTHGGGATSIDQPNDTHMHAGRDDTQRRWQDDTSATKAVRFNDRSTIHYPYVDSSVPKAPPLQQPKAPPPAVPYTGADVRRSAERESVVTERADQDKWEWGSRVKWWQSDDEWCRR